MSFDYKGLKSKITSLFEGVKETEKLTELGNVLGLIDDAEKEEATLEKEHQELRTNYINVVKGISFKGEEKQAEDKGKDLDFEDFLKQEYEKEHNK